MILEFNTLRDYEHYFSNNKVEVSREIVRSILYSFENNLKEAVAFEVVFESTPNTMFEISVKEDLWEHSLDACMKIFTEHQASDDAIDTYLIKKKIIEGKEVTN